MKKGQCENIKIGNINKLDGSIMKIKLSGMHEKIGDAKIYL